MWVGIYIFIVAFICFVYTSMLHITLLTLTDNLVICWEFSIDSLQISDIRFVNIFLTSHFSSFYFLFNLNHGKYFNLKKDIIKAIALQRLLQIVWNQSICPPNKKDNHDFICGNPFVRSGNMWVMKVLWRSGWHSDGCGEPSLVLIKDYDKGLWRRQDWRSIIVSEGDTSLPVGWSPMFLSHVK